jgi:hypothetical protein
LVLLSCPAAAHAAACISWWRLGHPAQLRVSAHFFSEMSHFGRIRIRPSGIGRPPACRHSKPCASVSSATGLANSLAFSFSGTPLCAGHHWMSITMPGLPLLSAAIRFHAWIVYVDLNPWARFLRCHAPGGHMGVGEDGEPSPVLSVLLQRFPEPWRRQCTPHRWLPGCSPYES